MSIDRSLKTAGSLARHRNVLTRAERIERLATKKQFDPASGDPLGLRKVANRKVVTGGKTKKKAEEGETPEGAAPATAAPAAAAPAAGKAAKTAKTPKSAKPGKK